MTGRTARRALVVLLGFAAPASSPAAPPLEPVITKRVPMPKEITQASNPRWTQRGDALVFNFVSAQYPDSQIGLMRPDGTGFRCLTCRLKSTFGKPFVFPDSRRLLTSNVGGVGPLSGDSGNFSYEILECRPSIYRCDKQSLGTIQLPGGDLSNGTQNREGRISADGKLFAWTEVRATDGPRMAVGRLITSGDGYAIGDARVLNPPYELDDNSRGWRSAGPQFEFKRFSFDGATATYAGAGSASNFDVYNLDLRTGARQRATTDVEWDEDSAPSPDGKWLGLFSSRRIHPVMRGFAEIQRPEFIEFATFPQIGRYILKVVGNSGCLLEPWLIARSGDRGAYGGQPLNPTIAPGWRSRPMGDWSPDGTRFVFNEQFYGENPPEQSQRLVIARLPARHPGKRPAARTVFPTWAPTLASYSGIADDQIVNRVIHGARSGTATLNYVGSFGAGTFSVTYDNYSDDGEWVIDGKEMLDTPLAPVSGHWTADLTASGPHTGSLLADVQFQQGKASGSLTSTLDGQTIDGLPKPAPCPDFDGGSPLHVTVEPLGASGDRRRVRVEVRGNVWGDPLARPVRYATVRAGRIVRHTGRAGRVTLTLPAVPAKAAIRASAGGFAPASARG